MNEGEKFAVSGVNSTYCWPEVEIKPSLLIMSSIMGSILNDLGFEAGI